MIDVSAADAKRALDAAELASTINDAQGLGELLAGQRRLCRNALRKFIAQNGDACRGRPCSRGLRIRVKDVLDPRGGWRQKE